MTTAQLNLHRLIAIEAELPDSLLQPLLERFGRFTGEGPAPLGQIEIKVLEHSNLELRARPGWVFDEQGAHWMGRSRRRLWIQPIESGFRLYVRPPHYGRLHFALLWVLRALMLSHGGAMMHGAVLKHKQHSLMLMGRKMIGKTQLVLALMNRGWQLLAEDKFLFLDGHAWCLQDHFFLRNHHIERSPELADNAILTKRKLPWVKPAQWQLHVESQFPGQLNMQQQPTTIAWLTQGSDYRYSPISPQALYQAILTQQRQAFSAFLPLDGWYGLEPKLPAGLPLNHGHHLELPVPLDCQRGCQLLLDSLISNPSVRETLRE